VTIRLNHEVLKVGGQRTAVTSHRAANQWACKRLWAAAYRRLPGSLTSRGFAGSGCQAAIARAFPRLRGVGHAREQATQLDGDSELAALVEGGTDGGDLCLRDDEHAGRMVTRTAGGKRGSSADPARKRQALVGLPPIVGAHDIVAALGAITNVVAIGE
jgi:hypothetical protein